jgi:sec-independent protein translocase protein TatC
MAKSFEGVPGDINLELEEHLSELARRFLLVVVVIGIVTLIAYPFSGSIINLMKERFVPPEIKVIVLNPVEIVFTQIKIAIAISFIVGAPLIVYEAFSFMRPGLYPSERRFFVGVVPISLLLFLLGATFSYLFLIEPLSKTLIGTATQTTVGAIFQVPLIINLLIRMDLVAPSFLRRYRRYIYALMFFLVTLFNPDPTLATPFVITAGFIGLYELSLWLFAREKK